MYENETEVGQAMQEKINEGKITREEMFITTKVLNILSIITGVYYKYSCIE